MDYRKTAESVLEGLGGAENVDYFTHCATRLRVTLHDKGEVDKPAIEKTEGVLSVIEQSGQTQVVIGNEVASVYDEMTRLPGMDPETRGEGAQRSDDAGDGGDEKKAGVITRMFDVLSDSFRPVLWALLGSSMILTLIVLLQQLGVFGQYTNFAGETVNVDLVNGPSLSDDAASSDLLNQWRAQFPFWFIILGAAMSVLNFMPILIGATAAKRLGANMWVGAAIPAALMTSAFTGLNEIADGNGMIPLFSIGGWDVPLYMFDYTGQIFPPLFAVALLAPLERLLKRIIPNMLHMVFVPMISLLIMVPLTALVIGPIGVNLGLGISEIFQWLNDINPAIVGVVVAGAYLFMVPLGLHWPLNAVMISNLSTLGYDFIQSPMAAYNFAVFGVVTGVAIRAARDKELRQVATGAAISGLVGGISEPSLYGVVLRYKRVFPLILVPAMIAGGLISWMGVRSYAFAFTSLLSIPAMQPIPLFVIGLAVAFGGGLVGVLVFGFRSREQREADLAKQNLAPDAVPTEENAPDLVGAGVSAGAGSAADGEAAPAGSSGGSGTGLAAAPVSSAPSAPWAASGDDAAGAGEGPAGTAEGPASGTAASGSPEASEAAEITVGSPLSGRAVPLSEVPDPIFAAGKLGQGVAIEPSEGVVSAPGAGKVIATPASGHAIGLRLDSGVELLIHVGIDTVNMRGEGFEVAVSKGDRVEAGQRLLAFDAAAIREAGYPTITPVLVTNTPKFAAVEGLPADAVQPGDEVISIRR
ncbi:glucose PTS transporter subunit IIA [Rothia halotolerans]|uniref:glucose PTS transporter subunit IIA n=1 Tax=Rothia halotolerans TaxID=405770 RepID=UPI00101C1022|nr:glucose PTS transporter subunit IIA [Rothia halotolerans]